MLPFRPRKRIKRGKIYRVLTRLTILTRVLPLKRKLLTRFHDQKGNNFFRGIVKFLTRYYEFVHQKTRESVLNSLPDAYSAARNFSTVTILMHDQ